eukprot:TRINITY_DN3476_c0_g1_i11.p1 TRINITY_DN3476_c0_g1~~TRINITY_DN3476_c0_g1_i11.p1  ORF type:complete len:258 (-),score=37.50 TRINITY_DN3476_c0_g1_i11:634-1407(-)
MSLCSSICPYLQPIYAFIFSIPLWHFLCGLLAIYTLYYYFCKRAKLALQYQSTELNEFVCKNSPSFQRTYRPTFFLFTGLLQTAFYEVLRKVARKDCGITYDRELVKLADGGQLSLDWPILPKNFSMDDGTPILAILSGMTGGRKDVYVATLISDCFARNCRPVLLNQRGLSNTPITTAKLYCGETTDDVHTALLAVKKKHPANPIYAVGLSLGANIITNVFLDSTHSTSAARNRTRSCRVLSASATLSTCTTSSST